MTQFQMFDLEVMFYMMLWCYGGLISGTSLYL